MEARSDRAPSGRNYLQQLAHEQCAQVEKADPSKTNSTVSLTSVLKQSTEAVGISSANRRRICDSSTFT